MGSTGATGATGATGETGATGAQGEQGPAGPTFFATVRLGAPFVVNLPTNAIGSETCPAPKAKTGGTIEVMGSGWSPDEPVIIYIVTDLALGNAGREIIGSATANEAGAFDVAIKLKSYRTKCAATVFSGFEGVPPGAFTVEARGAVDLTTGESIHRATVPVVILAAVP